MKKILMPFENGRSSSGAFDFVCRLNEISPILLTGVFLREVKYAPITGSTYFQGLGVPLYTPAIEIADLENTRVNIDWFEGACEKNNIKYRVHRDTDDMVIEELKKESRFADLLLIGSEVFYNEDLSEATSEYLKSILHLSECPVLLVPEKNEFPGNVILAYDNTESSVYAIKQFAYIFPELANLPTTLVHISKHDDDDVQQNNALQELATGLYKDISFFNVEPGAKETFNYMLNDKSASLLVAGSFGRSGLSELFRKSFVMDIIKKHTVPVFIAHK